MQLKHALHRIGVTVRVIRTIYAIESSFAGVVCRDGHPSPLQLFGTVNRRYASINTLQTYGRHRRTEIAVLASIFLDNYASRHENLRGTFLAVYIVLIFYRDSKSLAERIFPWVISLYSCSVVRAFARALT